MTKPIGVQHIDRFRHYFRVFKILINAFKKISTNSHTFLRLS